MASPAYNQFVARVKADGGRVTVAPSGRSAAAYPPEVWVPKANGKLWPLPNEYSKDGRTGYYHVPSFIAEEIASFSVATPEETKAGADTLMEKWGVPNYLQSLGKFGSSILAIALIYGAVYFIAKGKGQRRWD